MAWNSNNLIKKIIGTPRKRGGKKDWDFDGVSNKKDCQPWNTMRQDEESTVYGIERARWLAARTEGWKKMKNFRLIQEVDYYLKYRPSHISLYHAKKGALDELKRLR